MVSIPQSELVPISELKVDGENPNRMTSKQLARLKKSVEKYGFIVPIITNKDLLVADGEQRLNIAQTLKMKQVPVIRLPIEDVDRRLLRQVLNKLRREHELIADALEFERIIGAGHEDELKHLLDLSDSQLERYLAEIREPKEIPPPKPLEEIETDIQLGDRFRLGEGELICGDCLEAMQTLPDHSIDFVMFSPPYWGLRDYGLETVRIWGNGPECKHEWTEQKSSFNKQGGNGKQSTNLGTLRGEDQKSNFCIKCGAWRGSLGLEPHPQMFVDHLVEICREIRQVLKPSGTFWLNLGDTYCGSWGNYGAREGKQREQNVEKFDRKGQPSKNLRVPQSYTEKSGWLQPKQLLGIPWRVVVALQGDGWILRNDVIWHKPNHMPSSVKDRLTNAYEHVFLFAKNPRYYFDLDAIRKPHKPESLKRDAYGYPTSPMQGRYQIPWEKREGTKDQEFCNPKGKNPSDVWRVSTISFHGAHFATFPPKLINPIVKAGCPKNGIVLDPLAGSGTVGQVARRLGRNFVLIEIKPEYVEIAKQRVRGKYRPPPENVVPLTEIQTSLSSTNR